MRNLLVLVLTVSIHFCYSQSCCTGGIPFTGSLSVNNIESKSLQLGLRYDLNSLDDLIQNGEKLDNNINFRSTHTVMLQVSYGLFKNFTISVLTPYVWLNEEVTAFSGEQRYQSSGLGDLMITGSYSIINTNSTNIGLGGGIKLGNGKTKIEGSDGFVLPPTLQPGTGSTDYILFASFNHQLAIRKQAKVDGSVFKQFNTESSSFASFSSYKFGNSWQFFTTYYDQFLIGGLIFTPSIGLRGRVADEDEINSNLNNNTGGFWLSLTPGIGADITKKLAISVNENIPIYRSLNGFQLTTTHRLILSLRYTL